MPIAALDDQESVTSGWLQAVSFLKRQPSRKCYNLAYVMTRPGLKTFDDAAIIAALDGFARSAGEHPVNTVANTIFPSSCYRQGDPNGIYEHYPKDIYPRVKKG